MRNCDSRTNSSERLDVSFSTTRPLTVTMQVSHNLQGNYGRRRSQSSDRIRTKGEYWEVHEGNAADERSVKCRLLRDSLHCDKHAATTDAYRGTTPYNTMSLHLAIPVRTTTPFALQRAAPLHGSITLSNQYIANGLFPRHVSKECDELGTRRTRPLVAALHKHPLFYMGAISTGYTLFKA